jgi:putative ABC transport system permease protein
MIPVSYNVRNLVVRKGTTIAAVFGIALVTLLFAGVFMLNHGINQTIVSSGHADNAIILRQGSDNELSSGVDMRQVSMVGAKPEVAHAQNGAPLIVGEVVVVITADKIGVEGGVSNVLVRGTSENVWDVRPEAKLIAGRKPQPGTTEVAIGKAIRGRFKGVELGESFNVKKNRAAQVVGVFDTGGTAYDSEVWADVDVMRDAFGRKGSVSSMHVHLASASKVDAFKAEVEADQTLGLQVQRESTYFEHNSEGAGTLLFGLGLTIAVFFALGAIIGASITMYAQVANRVKEIGTLRALGFSRFAVLSSFIIESLMVAVVGGAIGVVLSFFLGFVSFSTINMTNWSEIVFRFETTPQILGISFAFALFMGFIGGFLPALRAARLSPLAAIRG